MALSRSRRRGPALDYWPGFVDAMATLLLVIIFLLSVFILAQFFLSQEISGRDTVLQRLNQQIAELTELLALERASATDLRSQLSTLNASLAAAEGERSRLQGLIDAAAGAEGETDERLAALQQRLSEQEETATGALSQVELLNQQISALRRQIAALEAALDVSEDRDTAAQARIADLGRRLNVALAQRVQELSRYRSDFFGRLRQILSQRSDIRVEGDRFVFQSELLFNSGSDEINPAGQGELAKLAEAILELEAVIPGEIAWVIRVDGHTDNRPISGAGRFRSNWDLSTARAVSVVRYLIDQGVSPQHLVAAGFGEFQPIAEGDSPEALARNRRIEFKLTER
ncbi:MAG: peptidoglycan -binding protein [Hyphomicrobiaceae bacterium]|nr:peptidoglycan -binding protein [Hyphomicrobiaceae bacterium]